MGEPKSPTKNNKIPLVLWSASWELGSGAIIGANDGLRRKKKWERKNAMQYRGRSAEISANYTRPRKTVSSFTSSLPSPAAAVVFVGFEIET